MNVPPSLRYTSSHEWIREEPDGTLTVGITDHAQDSLGDLVFIELPKVGRTVRAKEAIAVVESVKAASDIYAPVDGEIIAMNEDLATSPEKVNADPYGNWLFKLKPVAGAVREGLLDAGAYETLVGDA